MKPYDDEELLRRSLNHYRWQFMNGVLESGMMNLDTSETPNELVFAFKKLYRKINKRKLLNISVKEKYLDGIKRIWENHYNDITSDFSKREVRRISKLDINDLFYKQRFVFLLIDFFNLDIEVIKYNARYEKLNYSLKIYLTKDIEKISKIYLYNKTGVISQQKSHYWYNENDFYRKAIQDLLILLSKSKWK